MSKDYQNLLQQNKYCQEGGTKEEDLEIYRSKHIDWKKTCNKSIGPFRLQSLIYLNNTQIAVKNFKYIWFKNSVWSSTFILRNAKIYSCTEGYKSNKCQTGQRVSLSNIYITFFLITLNFLMKQKNLQEKCTNDTKIKPATAISIGKFMRSAKRNGHRPLRCFLYTYLHILD